jgi:hypothetical protein
MAQGVQRPCLPQLAVPERADCQSHRICETRRGIPQSAAEITDSMSLCWRRWLRRHKITLVPPTHANARRPAPVISVQLRETLLTVVRQLIRAFHASEISAAPEVVDASLRREHERIGFENCGPISNQCWGWKRDTHSTSGPGR